MWRGEGVRTLSHFADKVSEIRRAEVNQKHIMSQAGAIKVPEHCFMRSSLDKLAEREHISAAGYII